MFFGLAFIALGLEVISRTNLFLALGIGIFLGLYQVVRQFRNTIRARIDRIFRCHNEIRLADIARRIHGQSPFSDIDILRKTAALYAERQRWPRLKIESFRLSFIDTKGTARITDVKELAYALLVFEAREEHIERTDRSLASNGRNSQYLDERYERFTQAASKRSGET